MTAWWATFKRFFSGGPSTPNPRSAQAPQPAAGTSPSVGSQTSVGVGHGHPPPTTSPSQPGPPAQRRTIDVSPSPGRRPLLGRRGGLHLSPGAALGQGGQGTVRDLPGENRVIKTYAHPISGGVSDFERFASGGSELRQRLAGTRVDIAWPEDPVVHGDALHGYCMAKIPDRFYFEFESRRRLRTLQFAVPRESAFRLPFDVPDRVRLELVRHVAVFLADMHACDLVYGDLSWTNFAFSLDPTEISVHDFDSSRRVGAGSFTRAAAAQTVDWADPHEPNPRVASLDGDRYKFALLSYRLLVSRDLTSAIDPDEVGRLGLLPRSRIRALSTLWIRASLGRGQRPQLGEWVSALDSLGS
jgi:hypothetical protein